MKIRLIIGLLILVIAMACGGGGGGGSSVAPTTSSVTEELYSVRYKESTLNSPTLEVATVSSLTTTNLTGKFDDTSRVLRGAAMASETEVTPEFLLGLQIGSAVTNPSEKFNAVIYGLLSSQGKVGVGQFQIDFSTSPASASLAGGLSNTVSQAMLTELFPTTDMTITEKGLVTWGNWSGGISKDGNHLLLSNSVDGKLFMLASKVKTFTISEIQSSYPQVSVQQYDDSAGTTIASSYGQVDFGTDLAVGSSGVTFTRTNGSVSVPSGTRNYNLSSSDSSILELKDINSGALTEHGFLGYSEYIVTVNPDTESRPAISVIFK